MIKFNIFNYDNIACPIQIEDKNREDIFAIHITILSGDECVKIQFKDGEIREFDAALEAPEPRFMNYYDGEYSLTFTRQEDIDKWLNWMPNNQSTWSYNRQNIFS